MITWPRTKRKQVQLLSGAPCMKHCNLCNSDKVESEFAIKDRVTGKQMSYCRTCQNIRSRAHYRANKDKYLERARKEHDWQVALVRQIKSAPCVDCGKKYPYYVMQFDHLKDKEFNIGESVTRGWALGRKKLLKEIAKCEIVCANCHAERTHKLAR